MPTAYGYARVSHRNSHTKGDSIAAQKERIDAYYDIHLKQEGIKFGGSYDDNAPVSAYKVPFHARPTGQELLGKMKPGDHLIIDKVDRLFRSMRDYSNTIHHLENLNITVHIISFLGQSIRHDKGAGKFMLAILVACAELESDLKSERICQAKAYQRSKGMREVAPPGTKIYRKTGQPDIVVWDWPVRAVMQKALDQLSTASSWVSVFIEMEKELYKLQGRKKRSDRMVGRNFKTYKKLVLSEFVYQDGGFTDPMTIPMPEEMRRLTALAENKVAIAPHKRRLANAGQ